MAAIGIYFTAVSTTPAAAPAAPVAAGICDTTAARAKVSTTFQNTISKTYVDVIETAIPFTQRRTGCVIISFSSEVDLQPNDSMYVVATVDGFGCAPYNTVFAGVDNLVHLTNVRAMNFLCLNVGTGNHTAKMMFRSFLGNGVGLGKRTMILHYAK